MNALLRLAAAGLCSAVCGTAAAATAPAADETPPSAATVCEAAVAHTLRDLRGKAAHEVQFGRVKPVVPPPAGNDTALAGQGQYRATAGAARPFSYTCTYDAATGKASGVVLKEEAPPVAAAERPWEPDLTHVSPEACEAAAAAALKEQYPPSGGIRFESDSRRLRPAANAGTSLEGRGSLERAAGMNAAPFSYQCVFAPGSGKLLSVQTRD